MFLFTKFSFYFLLFTLISSTIPLQAQNHINDSLLIISKTKILELCHENKIDKALKLADSIVIVTNNTHSNSLIQARLIKSEALSSIDRFEEALKYSQETLIIAKKNEDSEASVLYEIGKISRFLGKKNQSIEYLTKALVLYEKDKNKKGIAKSYTLLGVLKTELGDFKKGQAFLHKALKIHQTIGDEKMIQNNWMGIGYGYFKERNYNAAKQSFLEILYNHPNANYSTLNNLYLNLATIYQRLSKLDSAYYFQLKAIKLAEKTKSDYILATLYYNASTVKLEQNQLDSTRYFAEKGLESSKKMKYYDRMINNYSILQLLDSLEGKPNEQNLKLQKIIQLKDSILSKERESLAKEMEEKYSNLKKDEIISLQNQNLDVAKEKNNFLTGLIFVSLILLLILLMFAYTYRKLMYKNKRLHQLEKKQILQQLKDKEQELVGIALQVEQKNMLIDKFYNKLKKTDSSEQKDATIQKILKEVKVSLNIQKDVELFTERFGQLHHDFIGKLKREHPQLTLKEIKFLSFLKVGLSTKQIASMQNITPAAVHKMRYRIKKKLQLDKEISLDDFVVSIQ